MNVQREAVVAAQGRCDRAGAQRRVDPLNRVGKRRLGERRHQSGKRYAPICERGHLVGRRVFGAHEVVIDEHRSQFTCDVVRFGEHDVGEFHCRVDRDAYLLVERIGAYMHVVQATALRSRRETNVTSLRCNVTVYIVYAPCMTFDPMTVVVIAANVLGAAMAIPQARKLLRNRSVDGISVSWAAMSATVNAWWGVYGIGTGDWSIVPVSVVSVLAYLVIAAAIVRFAPTPARHLIAPALTAVAAISAIPAIALMVDGWVTAGITLGALYGIQLSPAVVTVYRAVDVSGVALATWVIALVEAGLWGAYGIANLDVGLIALASTGLFMSTLVLVRLFVRRPRRAYATAGAPAFAAA